jgi:hypothetical protein
MLINMINMVFIVVKMIHPENFASALNSGDKYLPA